jgi:imidazole glycerol phosphate synthase subunit HisF
MDAKRIVPELTLRDGKVVPGPGPDLDPARLADWACHLEQEGADGILFREVPGGSAPAPGTRAGWIREVAGHLGIPFSLEARLWRLEELEEILAAGADKVVLAGAGDDPLLGAALQAFGRIRLGAALDVVLGRDGQWLAGPDSGPEERDALAWMAELEQRGAGEILVRTAPEGEETAALFQAAARLPLAVLFRSTAGPDLVAEALLHGADGLAYPAFTRTSDEWKTALAVHGLALRQA